MYNTYMKFNIRKRKEKSQRIMNLLLLVLLRSVIATGISSQAEDVNTKPASEASPATPPQPETKSVLGWVGNKSSFKGKIPRLPRDLPKAMSVIPDKENLDGYWGVISEAMDLIPAGSNKTSQKTLVEVSPSFHPLKTLLPGHREGKVEPPKPVSKTKKLSQSAKNRKFISSVFKPWPGLMNGRWKRRLSTHHDEPSSHRRKSSDGPHSSSFRQDRTRLKPSFAIFSHKSTTTTPKPNFSPFRRNKEPSTPKQSNPKKNFISLQHNRGSTSQPTFKPLGFEELNSLSNFGYSSHDEFASQSNSGSSGQEEYTSQSDFDHEESRTEHEEYLPQSTFDSTRHEKPPSESDLASHDQEEYGSQSDFDSLGNKDSASHFSSSGRDESRPQSNLDSPSGHDKHHSSFSPFRHEELPSQSYFQSVPPDESKRHFRFNAVRDQKSDSHSTFRQPEPQTQSYFASSKPRESIFQKNFKSSQHPESNPRPNFKSTRHPESIPLPKFKSIRHPESNHLPNFKSIQNPESNHRPVPLRKEKPPSHSNFASLAEEEPSSTSTSDSTRPSAPLPHSSHWPSSRPDKRLTPSSSPNFFTRQNNDSALPPQEHLRQLMARPKENATHENFVYYSTNPDPTNQGAEHHLAIVEVPKGARGRIPLNNVHVIAPESSRGNMHVPSEKGSLWTKPYMVKQGEGEGDSAPYLVIPFSERDTRKHGIDNVALPLQKAPPEIDQLKNSFNQLRSASKAESSSLYGTASVGFGPPKNEDVVLKGIRQYSSQHESAADDPYNTGHPQTQSISQSQPGSFKYGPPKTRSIIRMQDPMSPASQYSHPREPSPPSSQAYSTPPENQNYQSEPESPPSQQYSPTPTYFPPSPMPAPPSTKNSPKRWPNVITTPKPAAPASTPPAETPPQIYRTPNLRLPYVRHTRKTSSAPSPRPFPFNFLERSRKTFTKSIRDFPKWLDGVVFGDESRHTNVVRRPQPNFRFPNYSSREKVRGISYPNVEPAKVQEQASNAAPTQNSAQVFSPPKVQTTGLPIRTRNPAFFSQPPLGEEQINNMISEPIRTRNPAFFSQPPLGEEQINNLISEPIRTRNPAFFSQPPLGEEQINNLISEPIRNTNAAFHTNPTSVEGKVKKTPLPGNFAFNTKPPVTEGQTNNLIYKIPAENLAFFSKLPKHSLSILRDINKSNPGKNLAIYSKVRKPSSPQEQIPKPTSPNEITAFHPEAPPNADLIEEQPRNNIESEEGPFPSRPQALVAQKSSPDYDLSTALQGETQIHRLNPVSLMSKVQMPFGQSINTLVREDAQAPVEENPWSATLPFLKRDKFVPLHRGGSGVQGLDPIVNVADPFLSDTEKNVDIIPPQSNPARAKQNVDFKKYQGPKMIMFTLEDAIPLLRHGSERNVFIAPSLDHGGYVEHREEDFMRSSATGSSFSTVVMPPRHMLRRNPNQYYVPRGRPEAQKLRSIFPSSNTSNATDLSEDEGEEGEGEDAETFESDAIPEEIKDNLPFYDLLSLGAKLKSPVVAKSKVQQNPLKCAKKSFFQGQKSLSQESQASESKAQQQSQSQETYRPFFFSSQSQSKKEKNPSERVTNFQRQKQTDQPRNKTPRPRFHKYPNFTESKQRQTEKSRGTKKHRNMEPVGKSKFRSSFDEIKSLVSDNNSTLDKTENEEENQPETTHTPIQKSTLQPIYIAATQQSNRQVQPSKPSPRRENFFSRLFSQAATGTRTKPEETTTTPPKWGQSFNRQSKPKNEKRQETKGDERNPFGFKFLKSSAPPQSRAAPKDSKTSSFGSMFASATSREGASKRAKSIEEAVSLDDLMGAYAENMDEILGSHSEPESLVLKWPKYKRPAFKTDSEGGEESMKTSANESLRKDSLESTSAPEAVASESDEVEEEHVTLYKGVQRQSERRKKLENASPFQKFKKLVRKKEVKILKAERAQRDEASESQIATATEISVTLDPSTDSTTTATPPSTTTTPQAPTTFKLSRKDAHTIKPTNFLSMLRKRQKQWRSNKQSTTPVPRTPSPTPLPQPEPTPTARAFHVQRARSKPRGNAFSSQRETTTLPPATNAHTGRERRPAEEEPQGSESKVSERRKKRPVQQQTFHQHHYLDWEPSKFRPTITPPFPTEDASNVTPSQPTQHPEATELSPKRKPRRKLRRKSYEPKFSFGRDKGSEMESKWSPVDNSDFHESLSLPQEGLLQREEQPLPSAKEDNSKGIIYQSNSYTNVNVESSAHKHPS